MNSDQQEQAAGQCPVSKKSGEGECPYKFTGKDRGWKNPVASWFAPASPTTVEAPQQNKDDNDIPASVEEAASHPQARIYPAQSIPLNTHRVISSIPRSDSLLKEEGKDVPKHQGDVQDQSEGGNYWMYPSEQQFYNAMTRKGWKPNAEEMEVVVAIHNAVNERGWYEVKRWEKNLHDVDEPRLIRFVGRPNDMSPKAWLNSNIFGYKPPFDRHDWFVERNGKSVRYVIDFYNGNSESANASDGESFNMNERSSMYLDVRPALDTPIAFIDRMRMNVKEIFPGLFNDEPSQK